MKLNDFYLNGHILPVTN